MTKKVLLTGASGFLGKAILNNLSINKNITTLGRRDSDITFDLTQGICKLPFSDIVIHAAGKAHCVPKTENEKKAFYEVNVDGTFNLLSSLEQSNAIPKLFVFISSVAVYGLESGEQINEDSPLLAQEPYGDSKIQAERLIELWCKKNNVICSILRLPLLAGPNPPGNLRAMINSIKKGYYFNINGGVARKSMVLATDVANIIPVVAEIGGTYNLTDGLHPTFSQLSEIIAKQLNKKKPTSIPYTIAKLMAWAGDIIGDKSPINSSKLKKITLDLTFNDCKARNKFNWNPQSVLADFTID